MTLERLLRCGWLAALWALWVIAWITSTAAAEQHGARPQANPTRSGGYHAPGPSAGQLAQAAPQAEADSPHRVASRSTPAETESGPAQAPQSGEHPLMPAIRWAREGLENIRQIEDYSAVMVKRERVNGKEGEEEYAFVKVRHRPLSVYMYFLKPQTLQGREVIWIEGQNDGKMWAHGTGIQKMFGTVSLSPTSPMAMQGNRYPITEIGILNLVERLLEIGERDAQYGECEVKFHPNAKINDRTCTCIQVVHPVPRRNFLFHVARIFVDDELNVPVRYEAYDWPSEPGGEPQLIEQYTYLNLKLNNGFTDADFDHRNPQYRFPARVRN